MVKKDVWPLKVRATHGTRDFFFFFGGTGGGGGGVPGGALHHHSIGDWMIDVIHPSHVVSSMYGMLMQFLFFFGTGWLSTLGA